MAISNFTQSPQKTFSPAKLFALVFKRHHEKKSCSVTHVDSPELLVSARNADVLRMLTKVYRFSFRDSRYQLLNPLGICRVVSVVINSDGGPEVGLLSDSSDCPEYFPLSDLLVGNEVLRIN